MKAVIMAGGFGTRIRKDYYLARLLPKPLLPIGYRPIIEHILEKVGVIADIDLVYILTSQQFETIFNSWLETFSYSYSKELRIIAESSHAEADKPGAIGGLAYFLQKERIQDNILVIAGDNLFNGFKLVDFINFQKQKGEPVVACYDINDRKKAKKYGVVGLDPDKRISDFEEQPDNPKTSLISTACYLFPKHILFLLSTYLANKDNPKDQLGHFIRWLSQQVPIYGFVFTGTWFDIGDIASYIKADDIHKEMWREEF